jgi:glutathione peroxidase
MNLIMTLILFVSSIYSKQIEDINGATHSVSEFQGKKILIMNIATNSPFVSQLAGLQQLHQQHGDSLVILVFPSNSFGNEPRTNSEIKDFCQNQFGATFFLAAKSSVTGSTIHPLYSWLTQQSENGVMDQAVRGDFQKYLISGDGHLIGVFAGSVNPLSEQIQDALND